MNLIDKQDTFEIVRDQIAALLKLEVENQKALATAAGKDPSRWDFKVFSERSNPFEEFQAAEPPYIPIVNVWYDSSTSDDAGSDTVERQKVEGMYNIDCYAASGSMETGAGHASGDMLASLDVHRVVKLVRNILMSGENTYLKLRGTVWSRKVMSANIFQPDPNDATIQNIIGARIVFRVVFNELSPQVEGQPLETLFVQVKRAETGEILLETEYTYNGE